MLDYAHIGGSRTGSVWLYNTMIQHPEIVSPSGIKQPYFWNRKYAISVGKNPPYNMEQYKKLYQQQPGKTLIDFTDANSWIPLEDIKELRDTYPDVRITYCIRNPITTLWSHIVRLGVVPHNAPKNKIIDRMLDNIENIPKHEKTRLYKFFPNVQFKENYERWSKVFPKNQIMLFLHRDVKKQPIQLLQDISKHVGIDHTFWKSTHIEKKVNSGRSYPLREDVRKELVPIVKPQVEFFSEYFKVDLSCWYNGEE